MENCIIVPVYVLKAWGASGGAASIFFTSAVDGERAPSIDWKEALFIREWSDKVGLSRHNNS
jgi:hypothetical protein